MAVFAPMPRAREKTATATKTGDLRNERAAKRRSCMRWPMELSTPLEQERYQGVKVRWEGKKRLLQGQVVVAGPGEFGGGGEIDKRPGAIGGVGFPGAEGVGLLEDGGGGAASRF